MSKDTIDHPAHYGGAANPYEAIKVIEAWKLGFCLGNAVKYIARAGRKDPNAELEDLKKARWYLDREIAARTAPTASTTDAGDALAALATVWTQPTEAEAKEAVVALARAWAEHPIAADHPLARAVRELDAARR